MEVSSYFTLPLFIEPQKKIAVSFMLSYLIREEKGGMDIPLSEYGVKERKSRDIIDRGVVCIVAAGKEPFLFHIDCHGKFHAFCPSKSEAIHRIW